MLILSRRYGEGLRMGLPGGGEIRIWVEKQAGGRVRTLVKAPSDVLIQRIGVHGEVQRSGSAGGVKDGE